MLLRRPSQRSTRRSYHQLSQAQRYQISTLKKTKHSLAEIATVNRVTVAGVQQASHRSRTTRGDMLFLSFEDLQGMLDAILFPEIYRQAKSLISSTKPFLLTGIMEMDTKCGEPFLRVEKVTMVP